MLSDFENLYNIFDILNVFISNLQRIFSKEEIDRILSQLLFDENSRKMNNLNDYYEEDDSQEPQFNHSILYKFDKIDKKIAGYYDIEGPILFYDNYQHSIPVWNPSYA